MKLGFLDRSGVRYESEGRYVLFPSRFPRKPQGFEVAPAVVAFAPPIEDVRTTRDRHDLDFSENAHARSRYLSCQRIPAVAAFEVANDLRDDVNGRGVGTGNYEIAHGDLGVSQSLPRAPPLVSPEYL